MSTKETFTLYINSATTPTVVVTNLNSRSYAINWETVIPPKYKNRKFLCSVKLESTVMTVTGGLVGDCGFITADLSASNMSDGKSRSDTLCTFKPVTTCWNGSVWYEQYVSLPNENLPITTTYPDSQPLLINFFNVSGTLATTMVNHILILSFILIEEEPHSLSSINNNRGEYNNFISIR